MLKAPPRCLVCNSPVSVGVFVCSPLCENQWFDEQNELQREIERERDECLEDPNAGCWSQTW